VGSRPLHGAYLQSYESTDDAQIDGHIEPLSSRIQGTVIRAHAENNDRVTAGELLVEIDLRDFEVAVVQARARLELAVAQFASAKQDYAAALANVGEEDAANFRAQRDAQRFALLLDEQVVAQNEYDQYTATARVDAAKVDSAREAAGSVLKSIAAREADVDGAQAASIRQRSTSATQKSTPRPTASPADAPSSLALESNPDRP
jgi:membrane fusion protein (multidrug efflux system)